MKKLLLSTALLAAVAYPAAGQDQGVFRTEPDTMEIRASDFIGMRVYRSDAQIESDAYDGAQQDWEDLGEVNDIILSRDGQVEAVLVDIGGFLGIGENSVAVDMRQIRIVSDNATADNEADYFLVLSAPRESFEQAPVYDRRDDAQAMGGAAGSGTLGGTMPADQATGTVAADQATGTMPADSATGTVPADGTGDVAYRNSVTREGYVPAQRADLTAERLTGTAVYDANDVWVGEVSELLLTGEGEARAVVVDIGGFLGIGEKPVELELSNIDILRTGDSSDIRVYVSMTEEEMEAMPDYGG